MHSEFLPQLGRKPSLDTEQIKKTTRMMRMHDEECNVSHVLVMLTSLLCLVVSLVVRWLYTLLFTQFDLCKVSTTNLMVTLLNFINMALTYSSLLVLCTYTTFTLLYFHLCYTVWYNLYLKPQSQAFTTTIMHYLMDCSMWNIKIVHGPCVYCLMLHYCTCMMRPLSLHDHLPYWHIGSDPILDEL